jgi:hypothetical protein
MCAWRMVYAVPPAARGAAFQIAKLRRQARQVQKFNPPAIQLGEYFAVYVTLWLRAWFNRNAMLTECLAYPIAAPFV